MVVKEKLHKIIDEIKDEKLLKGFYRLISSLEQSQNGKLYRSLSEEQKNELNLSYEESFSENNLLDHEDVKSEYSQWL